jgi:hypothetical protein
MMSDDDFLAAFAARTLPPAQFNHVGHLRLAWINLRRLPLDDAINATCEGIRGYATHLGAADKFHWTVTEALLRLLYADRALPWADFLAANGQDVRARLALHYSDAALAAGRERFVAPDRAPL